jgi:type IV secretion system protein VirD4
MTTGPREETLYRLPAASGARATVAWRLAALALLATADGGWLATSFIAWRLGYAPRLGAPWLLRPAYPDSWLLSAVLLLAALAAVLLLAGGRWRRGALLLLPPLLPLALPLLLASLGPLYSPLRLIRWVRLYGHAPRLAGIVATGEAIGLAGLAASLAATAAHATASLRRLARVGDLHGSGHWASAREVAAAGLLDRGDGGEGGIVLGRLGRNWLVDRRDRHALVYAPSGTGKSTCVVIPTLLGWPGSILALDLKSELWQTTSGSVQSSGHRVVRFDPTLAGGSARYNPLLAIPRTAEEEVAAAQDVADILVNPEGREAVGGERFFEEQARALLTGVILHLLYTEQHPTLSDCLRLLSSPTPADTWQAMRKAPHDPGGSRGWVDRDTTGARTRTETHPTVASAASRLQGMDQRTATGVVATAQSKLVLFEDPTVCAATAVSDFRGEDLLEGPEPLAVYLTVAPSDLDRMRPLLRIVLAQVTRRLTRDIRPGRRQVLLMLDEFTALGRLDFMHRGIGFFRGYGIRVLISIQSLEQLFQIYGQHQSIAANCGVQVAYGANDLATARLLSELTGRRTVEYRRESRPRGILGGRRTESETEAGRPLLSPDEVRRLPEGEALIFVAGCAPIRGQRVPYWRDRDLAQRAAVPPPKGSERAGL